MSKKDGVCSFSFFHADLGGFFVGPMFFSFGLKWDVCFFLPFLGVISPWGKQRKNKNKKQIKHSQHIILIDLSN